MKINFTVLAQCMVITFCVSWNTVFAETVADDFFSMSPAELAAIPVTIATRTPKPVFQSAAVTSVITADQIKSMGATELHEVLETVPGMHASLQELTGDYHYSLRGIDNDTNSQLLMMLNGTRISTPFRGTIMSGLELPIEAIQRVEVIRGPGSALYGADAFAGVINIITKKAADIDGTALGVRAGNWDTQSGWGQHSAKWAGWDIAGSLQYQHTQGDDGRIINADSQSALDSYFGSDASHAPGPLETRHESLNGHLNLQRKHWEIDFWGVSTEGGTRAGLAAALDPQGFANGEQYLGDIRFSTEDWLDDWELTAHFSYLHSDVQSQVQLFPNGTQIPIGRTGNFNTQPQQALLGVVSFPDGVNNHSGQTDDIPAIELSSMFHGLEYHQLLLSVGFRHEAITTSELKNYGNGVIDTSNLPAVIDGGLTDVTGTPFVYLADRQRSIWSFVLQDEWQLANKWQLTTGVRYDNYSDFGGTINPRIALVWDVNEQLTSKLLYGKAFRAPNFSEQGTQNNPVLLGNQELKPETINTVELAFDYRPFSSLRTAINLYYYQIDNLITAVPDASGTLSTFRNNGGQNGYGTELEWNWQLAEKLGVTGNYAWQNAQSENTHSRVAGVPEHHVYVALQWRLFPQWQLQPQLNWIGGRLDPLDPGRSLDDYETIDLTLRGKKLFGHLNLSASLRNALDANNFEPAPVQLPENLPLPGRSFYFEASVNF